MLIAEAGVAEGSNHGSVVTFIRGSNSVQCRKYTQDGEGSILESDIMFPALSPWCLELNLEDMLEKSCAP